MNVTLLIFSIVPLFDPIAPPIVPEYESEIMESDIFIFPYTTGLVFPPSSIKIAPPMDEWCP